LVSTLGDVLLDHTKVLPSSTLSSIWATGKSVIVIPDSYYPDNKPTNWPEWRSVGTWPNEWLMKRNHDGVLAKLNQRSHPELCPQNLISYSAGRARGGSA